MIGTAHVSMAGELGRRMCREPYHCEESSRPAQNSEVRAAVGGERATTCQYGDGGAC